jgi:hypothetical protein
VWFEDFVLNSYLWLLVGTLFHLSTLAVFREFAAVHLYADRRRLWKR